MLRYQPEQPRVNVQYQIARTQEDAKPDSFSEGSSNYLTEPQDNCTLRNLLFPKNTKPSRLSGFTVNICSSVIGQTNTRNTDTQFSEGSNANMYVHYVTCKNVKVGLINFVIMIFRFPK